MKTKEDCYNEATLKSLGNNPQGTRQEIIYMAMDIYAQSQLSEAREAPTDKLPTELIDKIKHVFAVAIKNTTSETVLNYVSKTSIEFDAFLSTQKPEEGKEPECECKEWKGLNLSGKCYACDRTINYGNETQGADMTQA